VADGVQNWRENALLFQEPSAEGKQRLPRLHRETHLVTHVRRDRMRILISGRVKYRADDIRLKGHERSWWHPRDPHIHQSILGEEDHEDPAGE
jgi:hypothetical protein